MAKSAPKKAAAPVKKTAAPASKAAPAEGHEGYGRGRADLEGRGGEIGDGPKAAEPRPPRSPRPPPPRPRPRRQGQERHEGAHEGHDDRRARPHGGGQAAVAKSSAPQGGGRHGTRHQGTGPADRRQGGRDQGRAASQDGPRPSLPRRRRRPRSVTAPSTPSSSTPSASCCWRSGPSCSARPITSTPKRPPSWKISTPATSSSTTSPGEGDTLVVERERDLALAGQARQTVAEIDAALARIGDGTYGLSVISGRPIPKERLRAIPWATELVEEKVGGLGTRR